MRRAVDARAHGLEVDVHRTKDGHLVLGHDKSLERTTNGRGLIAQHTLRELRTLDAAFWWVRGQVDDHDAPPGDYVLRGRAPQDPDLCIPTLEEVLDRFHLPFTLEIKDRSAADAVVTLIRAKSVSLEDVIVTSFMERAVRRLRRIGPELSLAPGRVSTLWFYIRTRLRLPPRRSPYVAIQVPHRYAWAANLPKRWAWIARLVPHAWRAITVIDERFVSSAHRAGIAVHAWTIDDEQEMRYLIHLGVDGIMTDRPSVLAAVLTQSASTST
jgi:glycerophosphoryl diester phosphodiesterase